MELTVKLVSVNDYQFQSTIVDTKGVFNTKYWRKSFAVSYEAYIYQICACVGRMLSSSFVADTDHLYLPQ
jgi:hypothetical protein